MNVHSDGLSHVDGRLVLPRYFPRYCADLVADSLEDIAAEFDREAQCGGKPSQGLLVAAMVLRDRATETLNGYLDVPAAS